MVEPMGMVGGQRRMLDVGWELGGDGIGIGGIVALAGWIELCSSRSGLLCTYRLNRFRFGSCAMRYGKNFRCRIGLDEMRG
jgi:hypothetical protein